MIMDLFIIGGSLESLWWLFLTFLPQNFWRWQGPTDDTYALYECSLSGVDNRRWWGHSNPSCCLKKKQLLALTSGGDVHTLGVSP